MKRLALSLVASVAIVTIAPAASQFEGRVSFKMSSGEGGSQTIRYAIKDDKVRIEMPEQKAMGGMIWDTTKNEMTTIMDEQKMYMVMQMPDVTGAKPETKPSEIPTLEKTGETEKILGYTAEKYISTYQGQKTDLWLAEGLGTFVAFRNPMGGGGRGQRGMQMPQGWEKALAGKSLFPLRVVGRDAKGKESFKMEATEINKQTLPASLFNPPADYQRMDMGGMMRGMIPGLGGNR